MFVIRLPEFGVSVLGATTRSSLRQRNAFLIIVSTIAPQTIRKSLLVYLLDSRNVSSHWGIPDQ